jgi:hypothetical protein
MSVSLVSLGWKRRILAGEKPPAWLLNHIRAGYILRVIMSAPLWLDTRELRALERHRDALTAATGVRHVIDHVVPVTHPLVCGLTVPWNLQIVPWRVNAAKRNTWEPDQLDLPL